MLNMFAGNRDRLSRTSDGARLIRHNEKDAAMPDGKDVVCLLAKCKTMARAAYAIGWRKEGQ
jgi:hypothetical protein